MSVNKIVDFQGRKVTAKSLDFNAKSENWQQYELEDGSIVKLKVVLLDVLRLEGEYNDATNEPIYQVMAQQLVTVVVPDALKRKAQ